MKRLFTTLCVATCLCMPLGCDNGGGLEEVGEDLDEAVEDAGEALEDTGEKIEDGLDGDN